MNLQVVLIALSLQIFVVESVFLASAVKVNGTLPLGVPLAGYNYPPRRIDYWPLPVTRRYTTWMEPNIGSWDPTWVKALVIDDGNERFSFVTIDVIGADGFINRKAWEIAADKGFTIPWEKCTFSGSHTHSGPGAISSSFLWSIAPATDLLVPELQRQLATSVAEAMLEAEATLQPAFIDIGNGNLTGVTHNRRYPESPYVQYDTVDHNLGVIRIDDAQGNPLVTLWNFAIHGICYDAPNMKTTSDVMGSVCDWIEDNIGGVAMFWNGDAGDVNPIFSVACQGGPVWSGGEVIGKAVQQVRSTLIPSNEVEMASASTDVSFGPTQLNLTLQRIDNCTSGGPLDICSLCMVLNCDENIHLNEAWVENTPKFNAFRISVNGKDNLIVTIPGEALTQLGTEIRNDSRILGFKNTILMGYTNNHMGYFATANEYDVGGYESLLTFWGIGTAAKIRASCYDVASQVTP